VGVDPFPRSLQAKREEEKRSRGGLSGKLPIPIPIVHHDNQRVDRSAVIPSHPYYLHQNAKLQRMDEISISSDSREQPIFFCFN